MHTWTVKHPLASSYTSPSQWRGGDGAALLEQSWYRVAACPVPCLLSPMFPLVPFTLFTRPGFMLLPPCPDSPWLSYANVVIHRKSSRVLINKAKLEDSGNYTCVVENSVGKDNSTGTVNVQSSECHSPERVEAAHMLHALLFPLFSVLSPIERSEGAVTNRHAAGGQQAWRTTVHTCAAGLLISARVDGTWQ